MFGKVLHKFIPVVIIIIFCVILFPSSEAAEESQGVILYYDPSGTLTTNQLTDSDSQTFSFGPSAMTLPKDVGRWATEPLGKPIKISGNIDTVMWASGSGTIGTIYFEFRLYINDEYTGILFSTGTEILSQTPQEYSGSETGVEMDLGAGDSFAVDVSIYTSGRGGTVYWGSTQHPSNIMFSCNSVSISAPNSTIDSSSQKVTVNTTIISAFGLEDIATYDFQIQGPNAPGDISDIRTEVEGGQLKVFGVWDYGKDNAKTGEDYIVTATIEDNSGNIWSKIAEEPIVLEAKEEAGFQADIFQIIIIIVIISIVVFLIAYKLFLGKYVQEQISILKSSTEYFSDYKLIIVGEVLQYLSWYLLLVISLFIFRAAWEGWGNILVGLNYGLYQTVSVLLFLSLAKDSDVKGKRKNLLLSLIVAGSIILFIMAWLSFVPNPGITIIIIILFTLFVLCFYGFDNLKLVLITEYFPKDLKGKAFGFTRAIGNIGGLIGGVLSGFLLDEIGFWFCFLLAGFILIASFFIMFNIRDVGAVEERTTVNEWLRNFGSGLKHMGSRFVGWLKSVAQKFNFYTIDDYLFGFQNRKQMTLLFYTTLFTLIAYGMIVPFIMVFLSEARGESATVLGMVYTIFGIAIFLPINQVAAGWLCDKYGARKVYAGAIFAYIILWGIFNLTIPATSSNVIVMIVFIFPVWPFLWIGYKMFVADITPRSERVRGVTSIRLALGIGIVIGSIGGGVLLYYLSYETVFQLAMIFTFIAAVLGVLLLRITGEVDTVGKVEAPTFVADE